MKIRLILFLLGMFSCFNILAQQTIVMGSVKDAVTLEPVTEVTITIESTQQTTLTNEFGEFSFAELVPLGEQVLKISKEGYTPKRYPIVVNHGKTVNIADMTLDIDRSNPSELFTITLNDDELNDDIGGADNISGLLSSSQDLFQRTAAFEFSPSFFRIRGLDSDQAKIMINGIEMNKIYNGGPQWSNWGGLNDVMRNQELVFGLAPSANNFGGLLGTTNINTRASSYKKGGQATYSSSNRSYANRVMASYASGLFENGLAYTLMIGRRWGEEGFQDATFYDSNSFFASVEKKINENHSLNFTGIHAPNRRGKSSPNTDEVYDLKGITYNEYWGHLNGEKRNSRKKVVEEPILMLNHYWDISGKTTINSNLAYQFGKLGNSRLDYSGGANPSPSYYQGLPSYALADPDGPDYALAYELEQNFLSDGQIDWERIYDANLTNNIGNIPAAYVLYEDRSDDRQLTINSVLSSQIKGNILLNASLDYKNLKSENFAEILDLLGSTVGVLNVDAFDGYQFDLQNPNRLAGKGDKFRYHYNLTANVISGFAQTQFKYNTLDFYLSGSISNTGYQREGLYDNEANLGNSLGKGEKLSFTGFGAKAGLTYKISGRHLVDFNSGYVSKAPSLRNTYSNSRENHNSVNHISNEKISSIDASYIYRSAMLKAKVTAYYIKLQDANDISFYFAEGVQGFEESAEFIQEILQGIDKRNIGTEIGIEAQPTPTIKLKGVASVGQFTYDNNPNLYLTSGPNTAPSVQSHLKNYKVAGGPQRAYSLGFEYRDPDYWWFGASSNFFSHTYLDISPLTRTENFYLDADGLPFNDYNPEIAEQLLKQEKFEDYVVVNLVGGKSWLVDGYYVGFFASVGNLLDREHKTGGYEQGRNGNYRELRDDNANPKRVFGPKYWYGRGTNYFINVYFRF